MVNNLIDLFELIIQSLENYNNGSLVLKDKVVSDSLVIEEALSGLIIIINIKDIGWAKR